MKTLLLLSGGVDSAALAYWKRPHAALTIDYGQRAAKAETHAAAQVALALKIPHHVLQVDCSPIGAGNMSTSPALAQDPPTPEWWPFRNQILVTLAASWAATRNFQAILIGTVGSDNCHQDGRPEFIDLLDRVVRNQEGKIRVYAPAIKMQTVELVKRSKIPWDVLGWTHSCHVADFACGQCRGCRKHLAVRQTFAARKF